MKKSIRFVGLDVHKDSIEIAIAPQGVTEVRRWGKIGGDLGSLERVVKPWQKEGQEMVFAYEAGPCGFEIYRYLQSKKIECLVVAPSRIPRRPGDRVKTDCRDAGRLWSEMSHRQSPWISPKR